MSGKVTLEDQLRAAMKLSPVAPRPGDKVEVLVVGPPPPRPNVHLTAEQGDAYQVLVTAARDVVWNPLGSRPEEERERRLRAKALREALEAVEALNR